MKKTIVLILSAIILLSACEKKKDRLTNNTFSISIDSPTAVAMYTGNTVTLKAICINSKLENIDVKPSWSVSNNLGTFNPATGKSTVFTAGANSGSGKIYATYDTVSANVGLNITAVPGSGGGGTITYIIYDDSFNSDLASPGAFSDTAVNPVLASDNINVSQGLSAFKAIFSIGSAGYQGWFVSETGTKNMSAYSGGHLKFDIMTAYDIQIGIRSSNVNSNTNSAKRYISSYITLGAGSSFQSVSIPISDFTTAEPSTNLIQMKDMFIATALGSQIGAQTNQKFIIDNIRWTTN
jgi:hypothetical protein